MTNHLRQIQTGHVRWVHVTAPSEHEIQYLRDHFDFHPLDLQDCTTINQHPRVDAYDTYIFLILMFPFYDRRERKILASELDFFIGQDYLITVSDGKHLVTDNFFDECIKSDILRDRYLSRTAEHLLYELLHRLQESVFPMLDHVSEDINNLENQIFADQEKRMVHEILLIKRNIVNLRRVMNAHKTTLKKLIDVTQHKVFYLPPELKLYYENILDRTKDIWEILEIQKETINALQETNDAFISFKLNDTVKMLTAISASIFPATLVATLFGMNASSMPFVHSPYGFWILVTLVAVVATSFLMFFKKKGWL